MKVHLRKRKQSKDGSISLYLEIYKGFVKSEDGKTKNLRSYEYLNLYLTDNPKTPREKQSNKETLELAEGIKAKRTIEIKNGEYGFNTDHNQKANFVSYFEVQTEKRKESKGNSGNWASSLKHFKTYAGESILFKEIDNAFCQGFANYLTEKAETKSGNRLSTSSINSYFNKFRACLKQAVKERVLLSNPCTDVSLPKVVEGERVYLTVEELKLLVKTKCRYEVLKKAFLFACLTGLRWSDIQKLVWSEVQKNDDEWRITFHQKKTKGLQYLDISVQAREFLGEQGALEERVFTGLKYSSYMNVELTKWMLKAGITKDVTFHSSRHSFAVIQLDMGTEIFTLSKLLGHSEIKTTMIYSQIMDKKKKEAVNKMPNISL
jgi:integrase